MLGHPHHRLLHLLIEIFTINLNPLIRTFSIQMDTIPLGLALLGHLHQLELV